MYVLFIFKMTIEIQNLRHCCIKDLKDLDVFCFFKNKMESWNFEHGCIKEQWPYWSQYQDVKTQSGTSNILQNPKFCLERHGCSLHLQNQFEKKNTDQMANPSKEPPLSTKVPNLDLKDIDVLCTYKINLDRKKMKLVVSKTSYLDFGTWQDSKLFWAKLLWIKFQFESWASLS